MKLAINGGKKIRTEYFDPQHDYLRENKQGIMKEIGKVIDTTILSGYRGNASDAFWGGKKVQELESHFGAKYKTKALAVNSCTSALIVACGAIGLQPGDEVIVTPWSMSCSATAPLFWGATPVFADINRNDFCLDYESVKREITDKTKAIIVVDLFGQIFDTRIKKLAEKKGIYVIEDAAQAIGALTGKGIKEKWNDVSETYKGVGYYNLIEKDFRKDNNLKVAGTIGDIGCHSFTQGKILSAGEGGMITTDNEELYEKCALIRNHAESVLNDGYDRYRESLNMVGMNLRMSEITATILIEILPKLSDIIWSRQDVVEVMYDTICDIPFISEPKAKENYTHSYYCQPFYFDEKIAFVKRNKFIDAVKAELMPDSVRVDRGIPIGNGYINPIYNMPLFQNKGHWALKDGYYKKRMCPVAEKLNDSDLFISLYHALNYGNYYGSDARKYNDLGYDMVGYFDVINAFHKVAENIEEIR